MAARREQTQAEKLRGLRVLLETQGLEAVLVPSQDAHSCEYVAQCDERRAWLTGFDGSAGTALVSKDEALLWTDGRYFTQAEAQLTEFTLMKWKQPGVPEIGEYCRKFSRVGADFTTCSVAFAEEFRKMSGSDLIPTDGNLVDSVWGVARPSRPRNAVVALPLELAGESSSDKLKRVRSALGKEALVLNALDQIAWLLNLRGSDIECNPVFFAYVVVTPSECLLFTDNDVPKKDETYEVRPYAAFSPDFVASLDVDVIQFEKSTATLAMTGTLDSKRARFVDACPVELFKAVKNAAEIRGLKKAHLRDACVVVSVLAWLERRASSRDVTEWDVVRELRRLRSKYEEYRGDSFATISSSGANAAIIHYSPSPEKSAVVDPSRIFLLDTGAQFLDGTTDNTRTVHFSQPTPQERKCYTLVLKGHVDLATQKFPAGISGLQLDAIARAPLWQGSLDFDHGTGHGIGCYLNVHEGPFGIGGGAMPSAKLSPAARLKYLQGIHKGYYLSDEPGCYVAGAFGVRIEADLVTVDANHNDDALPKMNNKPFLEFDYLTLLPFCRNLIDLDLLAPHQRRWIDAYHAKVLALVAPALAASPLPDTPLALAWLQDACRPLSSPP